MQIALSILFHFYLLVLVRVLSSKRIFELSHAISQRPCRPSLPLLITKKIFGIKNLVRIIYLKANMEKQFGTIRAILINLPSILLQGVVSLIAYLTFSLACYHILIFLYSKLSAERLNT